MTTCNLTENMKICFFVGVKTLWEKEKMLATSIFSFSLNVFKRPLSHGLKSRACVVKSLPFPKRQILDSFKLKELADDNIRFDENGRKSIQMRRKHCGKWRNCSLRAISPFPTVFSQDFYYRHVKTRACLGKG